MCEVLGGWQVSGNLTYAAGNPMGVQNNYNPLLVNGNDFPDVVSSVKMKTYSYSLTKDYFTGKTATPPIQFTTSGFTNSCAMVNRRCQALLCSFDDAAL